MASIETRQMRWGTSYRVRVRHRGRNRSISFDDLDSATRWKALAEVNLEQALAALEQPASRELPPTVADSVLRHIEQLTGIEAGTRRSYRTYVEQNIRAHAIGAVLTRDLTRAQVAAWVRWLQDDRGYAGKTIRNRHALLSAAMHTAMVEGVRTDNPCLSMRLPRTSHEDAEPVFLSQDEFATLHAAIDEHYQPLVLLLVGTGMRFGEATALHVGDVSLRAGTIHIRRAWKYTAGEGHRIGPPKTSRSTRTVSAPEEVLESLRPLLRGRQRSEMLFTNRLGRPVRRSTFFSLVWQPAVSALGGDTTENAGRGRIRVTATGPGPHPRVHDLRHTYASWAIADGIPLAVIQRQLGHESITMTNDLYGHLARDAFQPLTAAIGARLPGRKPRLAVVDTEAG